MYYLEAGTEVLDYQHITKTEGGEISTFCFYNLLKDRRFCTSLT
jgi:hypothetical protein